jgi:hypothetical protein
MNGCFEVSTDLTSKIFKLSRELINTDLDGMDKYALLSMRFTFLYEVSFSIKFFYKFDFRHRNCEDHECKGLIKPAKKEIDTERPVISSEIVIKAPKKVCY